MVTRAASFTQLLPSADLGLTPRSPPPPSFAGTLSYQVLQLLVPSKHEALIFITSGMHGCTSYLLYSINLPLCPRERQVLLRVCLFSYHSYYTNLNRPSKKCKSWKGSITSVFVVLDNLMKKKNAVGKTQSFAIR